MITLFKTTYVPATDTEACYFLVQRMDDWSKPVRYSYEYSAKNAARAAAYLCASDRSPDWAPNDEDGLEYVGAEKDGLTCYFAVSK
jgi:hypothetical protein